jgi:hypothetical protein
MKKVIKFLEIFVYFEIQILLNHHFYESSIFNALTMHVNSLVLPVCEHLDVFLFVF